MRTRQSTMIKSYRFFQQLTLLPFIEKIMLFGSRAKGTHDSRSDIDLAVKCPLATESDWNGVMEIIENADTLLKIDCIRFDKIQNKKFENALMEAHIVLFERRKTL